MKRLFAITIIKIETARSNMSNTSQDVEGGNALREPLLNSGESTEEQPGLGRCSKYILLIFVSVFRVLYGLFYMISCRPDNMNDGFATAAERALFIAAPMSNIVSIGLEAWSGTVGTVVIVMTALGSVMSFIAGFAYAKETVQESMRGDICWIISGALLSVGHGFDALRHLTLRWNSAFMAKSFAFIASALIFAEGFIGLGESSTMRPFDFDIFKDVFFSIGFFFAAHAVTLVWAQFMDFKCMRRREVEA